MRSLHLGQVPMGRSLRSPAGIMATRSVLYTWREGLLTDGCVFCRVVARENPADIVYEDDEVLAFKDLYPKAPIHLLIIPKRHIESIASLESEDEAVVGHCVRVARLLAERLGY